MSRAGRAKSCATAMVLVTVAARAAEADRHEATIAVRPLASFARMSDSGARAPALVPAGGVTGGLSWGLRNWLDIGVEIAAVAAAEATYPDVMVPVSGNEQSGELRRVTRLAQLRGGATFRLGVSWVPTVHVGVGAGARMRSAATLRLASGTELPPDDSESEVGLDVVALVRMGLEHRLNRRWTIGLAAGATQCFGLGTPDVQIIDGSLTVAYSWYPLW